MSTIVLPAEECAPSAAPAALEVVLRGWSDAQREIMCLRAQIAPELGLQDAQDDEASHFLAYRDRALVGAVRVMFADDGPLDLEPLLPMPIPDACRREIVSASRLVMKGAIRPVLRSLMRAAWLNAWEIGSRVSIVTSPVQLTKVYEKALGNRAVSGPLMHPRSGRPVVVMVYRPAAGCGGIIDDVVACLPGPDASKDLCSYLASLKAASVQAGIAAIQGGTA